jgi:hypothetical protein
MKFTETCEILTLNIGETTRFWKEENEKLECKSFTPSDFSFLNTPHSKFNRIVSILR